MVQGFGHHGRFVDGHDVLEEMPLMLKIPHDSSMPGHQNSQCLGSGRIFKYPPFGVQQHPGKQSLAVGDKQALNSNIETLNPKP